MKLLQRSVCLLLLLAMAAGLLILPASAEEETEYPKIEYLTDAVFLNHDNVYPAMSTPYTGKSTYFLAYRNVGNGREAVLVDAHGNVVFAPKTPCASIQFLNDTTFSLESRDGERKYALYSAEAGKATEFLYCNVTALGKGILAFYDERTADLYSAATLEKQAVQCPNHYKPLVPFTDQLYFARSDPNPSTGRIADVLFDVQGNRVEFSGAATDVGCYDGKYLLTRNTLYSMDGEVLQTGLDYVAFFNGMELRRVLLDSYTVGSGELRETYTRCRYTLLSEQGKQLCTFDGYYGSGLLSTDLIVQATAPDAFGVLDSTGTPIVPAEYEKIEAPLSDARMGQWECYNTPKTDYFVAKKGDELTIFGADGTERAKIADCAGYRLDYPCLTVQKADNTQLLYLPDGTCVAQAPEDSYFVPLNGVLFLCDRNQRNYRVADPKTGEVLSETYYGMPQTCGAYGIVNATRTSDGYRKYRLLDAKGKEWNEVPFPEAVMFNRIGLGSYQSAVNYQYGAIRYIANAESEELDYSFADVPRSAWYYDAVQWNAKRKLFNGTSATQFSPEDSMTRAMLVTVLWRLENQPAAAGKAPFTDIRKGDYYEPALDWAFENGVVNGVSATRFDPDGNVTREQIATILYRYAQKKGYDTQARADLSGFPDDKSVSAYAKDALSWANASGLINGTDEGRGVFLDPTGNATRAQVAAILMRYVQKIEQK